MKAQAQQNTCPGRFVSTVAATALAGFMVTLNAVADAVTCDVMLGRPTGTSIAASVLASDDLRVYFEHGTQPGVYTGQTATNSVSHGVPTVLTIDSLQGNQRYYYRMRYATNSSGPFSAGTEHAFATQRARGSTFTFDIEADPHYNDNPVTRDPLAQGSTIPSDPNSNPNFPPQTLNEVFKVHRYPANFPGFAGKDLTPRGTIENYTGAATDTVGLGSPDVWTRSHFGSLSAVTGSSDHDGDGLTDIQEYQYGLDPNVWSSATNGIPDGWAIAYGFDPTSAGTASLINANGNTTLQNYSADLNPTEADSRLAFVNLNLAGGNVQLTWIGGSNAWQCLECSATLTATQWTAIFTNAPPTGITNSIVHAGAAAGSNLFYRINAHR